MGAGIDVISAYIRLTYIPQGTIYHLRVKVFVAIPICELIASTESDNDGPSIRPVIAAFAYFNGFPIGNLRTIS